MKFKKTLCMIPLYVWTLVFVLLPLAIVVYFAFIKDPHGSASFSLDGFRNFFSDPVTFHITLTPQADGQMDIDILATMVGAFHAVCAPEA